MTKSDESEPAGDCGAPHPPASPPLPARPWDPGLVRGMAARIDRRPVPPRAR